MESLKFARSRNMAWDAVARATMAIESEAGSSGLPPIRRAEQLSGYSTNQLRRMIAGVRFLDELAELDPVAADWLGTPKFSHAEMLAKIWRLDREKVLALLRSEPVLRYENLSRLFDTLAKQSASPMSAGKRSQKSFEEKCVAGLKALPFSPFGPGAYRLVKPRLHHPYCRPALLVRATVGTQVSWAGLDFVHNPNWDDAVLRQVMIQGIEARFLDLLFVFFPPGTAAAKAHRTVVDLQFNNVRIGVFEGKDFEFAPNHSSFSPRVDLRRQWVEPRLQTTLSEYFVT